MKKRVLSTFVMPAFYSAVLFLGGACISSRQSVESETEQKQEKHDALSTNTKIQNLPEDQKLKLAEPIIESVLKGIAEKDYKEYTRYALPGFKENVPESAFKSRNDELNKELGEFQSKTYLGVVNKKLFDVFVWKGKFSKSEDEWFMKLYLVDDEGKYKIYMFTISPL